MHPITKYINIRSVRPNFLFCHCKYSDQASSNTSKDDGNRHTPTESTKIVPKEYNPKDVTKEDTQWRTPWHQKDGNYYGFLRTFYKEDNNVDILKALQTNIDLRPSAIKKWWNKKSEESEILAQGYIPERNETLGNELAAAHFIVARGGAVKFHHDDKWIKADEHGNYNLPRFYTEGKVLEAIDCTDTNLYYEGLFNLEELQDVKWISFNGCEKVDDWFIDKVSNVFSHSLVYLDLRNCNNITPNGVGALYKMNNLKILYLDDFLRSTTYELTCLLLQEVNPSLDIKSDKVTFEIGR